MKHGPNEIAFIFKSGTHHFRNVCKKYTGDSSASYRGFIALNNGPGGAPIWFKTFSPFEFANKLFVVVDPGFA